MQVYGGHGYIKDNKAEQVYRDVRIAALWEGTTQIQARCVLHRVLHRVMHCAVHGAMQTAHRSARMAGGVKRACVPPLSLCMSGARPPRPEDHAAEAQADQRALR